MDQNRNNSNARVAGTDTGPLPQQGAPPGYGGQPTTYVAPEIPAEIRPQGSYNGTYAGETPSIQTPPPYQSYSPPVQSASPAQPVITTQTVHQGHRPHRTPLLGPLLLISAGVVFLLNNLGVLPWSVWETLGRLWPLILIAIGIDLIIGRRNQLVSVILVLLVVGAGGAFVYANGSMRAPGNLVTTPVDLRAAGVTSANVHIDLGMGNLTVGSFSGADDALATGELEYYDNGGGARQEVTQNGSTADVEISDPPGSNWGWNFSFLDGTRSPSWDIKLTERVPTNLEVDNGTGNMRLDLQKLQIGDLKVDLGTGNSSITLPATANNSTVDIDGGTGNIELIVPEGVEARIEIDSGLGNQTVDSRFAAQGEDVYESSGYDTATNKVTINIDSGVGNVIVDSK